MTDLQKFISTVDKLKTGRVLCIGDVMLDRFIYGTVDRISPEAPIPIFKSENQDIMLGGAGNVARNIAGLGANIRFISVVGNDQAGRDLTTEIGKLTDLDARLITDSSRKTSIKTRFIASNQQMMRADDETTSPVDNKIKNLIMDAVTPALEDYSTIVLADYGKGILANGIAEEIIQLAKLGGIPVVVDPQGRDYNVYMGASLVTPNRKELRDATGLNSNNTEEIVTAATQLARKSGIESVLVTRSGDGMTLVKNANNYSHYPAKAKEIFDVSGAGDTVVACIGTAISAGLSLEEAVTLSNIAAGIVVGKLGTAVAYSDDMIASLRQQTQITYAGKVLDFNSASDKTSLWRSSGNKIGFTNGCFDLLHPGHIALLNQAKASCDKLVVALNSDESIKRLKGKERPIQNQSARASVLASMEAVDLVILFEEDVPSHIINKLRPDTYIKGADYTVEELPEAELVKQYGGKIILADILDGFSTTTTIGQVKK